MFHRLVAVSMLVACGSEPTPFVPSGAIDYCEAIEPFFCDFYVRCGRMAVADAASCKDSFLTSCNAVFEPRYIELEAAGLLALDVPGIAACEAHLETVACDQQIQELDGPCGTMWIGQQPTGASCGLDVEFFVCAPGNECVLGLDFCGDCRPIVGIGQPCVTPDNTCGGDAFCDSGTCKARVANGGACTPDDRCMTGSTCDAGVCTPPTFVAEGAQCDQRRRCPYLTACIGGTCQATASSGETCTNDTSCEIGFCEGTCQAPRAVGEPCLRAAQCASGLCDGTTCQARPSACIEP